MKRRIVQISAIPESLGCSSWAIYALADDGTLWSKTHYSGAWDQMSALPDSDTPEPKDLYWTSEPITKAKP